MQAEGEVKVRKYDHNDGIKVADHFMLPEIIPAKFSKYHHELTGADLFTLYGHLGAWRYEPSIIGGRADRGIKIDNYVVYFEVDMCSMDLIPHPKAKGKLNKDSIKDKIERYIKMGYENQRRFSVVFVVNEKYGDNTRIIERGRKIRELIATYRRGNQLLVTPHPLLIDEPTSKVFVNGKDEAVALLDVIQGHDTDVLHGST